MEEPNSNRLSSTKPQAPLREEKNGQYLHAHLLNNIHKKQRHHMVSIVWTVLQMFTYHEQLSKQDSIW